MQTKHVFSVLGACAVIAFAAAACDDGHRDHGAGYDRESFDSCNQFTTCDTCTPQNGCGWCFDGTNSFCGSDANQCSSEWTWETNFCRDSADASVGNGDGASSSSCSIPNVTTEDSDAAVDPDAGDASAPTCAVANSGNLCSGSQYEVACSGDPNIPTPSSSLGCTIVPIPTPSDVLFYCCPCGQ